ncbi:MAG TPA: LuxR C-terminal-related transcriptional regulator [Candidatus Krumholzibacteria bacterium]|nr:LuxR C-terminal-related transcriptional regulator [Candidatus Krumholzibacteria bacterium]
MGVPVWITDPAGRISYLNTRAEALFGHTLSQWHGRPCHVAVAGRTRTGPFCCPRCRVRSQAAAHAEIEPVHLEVRARDGSRTEVCVVVIAVEAPAGHHLVHMVVDDERERRIRGFLERVVSRTAEDVGKPAPPAQRSAVSSTELSRREREVLSLLAADANLYEVAARLSISHVTVRNHVQHILSKLGVHSILEAVAVWLVDARRN